MSKNGENVRPRLCVLEKGTNGYGFHLHGEKGKTGQFIRLVEPDSPSESSGLRAGDRLVFVNGESVESESHQQVVSRIRATAGKLELIVVDQETDNLLQKNNLKCLKEYVTEGIPLTTRESDCDDAGEGATAEQPAHIQEKNGKVQAEQERSVNSDKECKRETRPRLCVIKKGAAGYGFNLHSEKSKPGQYIRAVDVCSPAEKAGLLPKDKILQVNGVPVDGKQHAEVVAAIKAGGDETSLLVVDPETDEFFKKCRVSPTQEHLTGPLPEPIANGEVEEKFNGAETKETKVSVSPSPSSASSCASLTSPTTSTPPTEVLDEPVEDAALTLNISLQQAKERAHKKRSNKRAPQMDWSKKNELFSNL